MLKKYALILTLVYSILLAIVSFIHLSGLPEINYSNTDKIFHFIAYSALMWLWFHVFYLKFSFTRTRAIVISAIISVIFGIIIEILQGVITNTRVTDNNDILANTLGVCFTILILLILKRTEVKKY